MSPALQADSLLTEPPGKPIINVCIYIWILLNHLQADLGKQSVNWELSLCLCLWLSGKESVYNARDMGLNPGSGRSPGGGNGNPLQSSCLENPMDRRAWQASRGDYEES